MGYAVVRGHELQLDLIVLGHHLLVLHVDSLVVSILDMGVSDQVVLEYLFKEHVCRVSVLNRESN